MTGKNTVKREKDTEHGIPTRTLEDLAGWDRKGYASRILYGMWKFGPECERGFNFIHLQRFATLTPRKLRDCRTLESVTLATEGQREVHYRTTKGRVKRLIKDGLIERIEKDGHDIYVPKGILSYASKKNMELLGITWSRFVEYLIREMRLPFPPMGQSIAGDLAALPGIRPVSGMVSENIPQELREHTNIVLFGNKEDVERAWERFSIYGYAKKKVPGTVSRRRLRDRDTCPTERELQEIKRAEAVSLIGSPLETIFRDAIAKYFNRLYPNGWLFIAYNDKAANLVSEKLSMLTKNVGVTLDSKNIGRFDPMKPETPFDYGVLVEVAEKDD